MFKLILLCSCMCALFISISIADLIDKKVLANMKDNQEEYINKEINREKQNLKKYNNTVVYNHNNYGFTEYGALVKGYAREVIDVEIHEGSLYYIFEGNEFINPFTKKEYYVYNTENIKPITQAEIDREITRQFEEFELLEKKFKEFNENISKYYK